ncbi:MAG TPA: FAD-binding protein [Solirubrobacteraceae bacterium]|jgi:succinate dehydrogenase/fumarate reductase flavoprotein subunit|nr:FAD-binding protein [Solirubrobacteraceae bacterium]
MPTQTLGNSRTRPELIHDSEGVSVGTDVLVIGGGPAGCWAAVAAAEAGASVVLADKGYCGTTGATASAGVGVWYVEPEAEARERAIQSREQLSGWLVDRRWMHRVLDKTHERVGQLADWGYPFPTNDDGQQVRKSLDGPEYMRRMRKQVARARVRILDHSPALELLRDGSGAVCGASGIRRQRGDAWTVRAGAVVIATGGCAFQSGGLGCNVLTGDGHLMAAELGAELSGMEFSNAYAISPAFSSVTKTAFYRYATFYTDDGVLEGAGAQRGRSIIARELLSRPVYARLDRAPADIRTDLRSSQPNFFLPFDRARIDPFTEKFAVTMRLEGTVRGTGGLRITSHNCETTVPGLYAAGDAATRELICGGFTGGGSHNAAWAISSGSWAGGGAAEFAKSRRLSEHGPGRREPLQPAGGAGIRACGPIERSLSAEVITRAVQQEVIPCDRNLFRSELGLSESLGRLDDLWRRARSGLQPEHERQPTVATLRARESVAMLTHARWMYAVGRLRTETRGMHKRIDHPELDPAQQHRQLVGGLDRVWTALDPERPHSALELAA